MNLLHYASSIKWFYLRYCRFPTCTARLEHPWKNNWTGHLLVTENIDRKRKRRKNAYSQKKFVMHWTIEMENVMPEAAYFVFSRLRHSDLPWFRTYEIYSSLLVTCPGRYLYRSGVNLIKLLQVWFTSVAIVFRLLRQWLHF